MNHRWSAPVRNTYKTERHCLFCKVFKITRHDGDISWHEYWREGEAERIGTVRPDCVRAMVGVE